MKPSQPSWVPWRSIPAGCGRKFEPNLESRSSRADLIAEESQDAAQEMDNIGS